MPVRWDELKSWRIINITGIRNEDLRAYMKKIQVIHEMLKERRALENEMRKHWTFEQLMADPSTFEREISINELWIGNFYANFLGSFKQEMRGLGTHPTIFVYHSPHAEGPISEEAEKQAGGRLRKPPLFLRARPAFKINKESSVAAVFTPEDRVCYTESRHVSLCPWYCGPVKDMYLNRKTDTATRTHYYQGQSWERYNEFLDFVEPHLPETPIVYAKRARRGSRHTADLKEIQKVLLLLCEAFRKLEDTELQVKILERGIEGHSSDERPRSLFGRFLGGTRESLTSANLNADVREAKSKLMRILCVQVKEFADSMPAEFVSEPEEG